MIKDPKPPDISLEEGVQSNFIAFFRSLDQDPAVVRIFDRKGYYSIHGDHAIKVAQQFYKTTAVVKYMGTADPLPGVAVNRNMFEAVLREFLIERAEYMVLVYQGHGATWTIARSGSPGRLLEFEDELFHNSDAIEVPTVLAVVLDSVEGERTVGAAYVDLETRVIGACQFHDDLEFCTLETLIVQLDAKECILPQESKSGAYANEILKIKDVMKKCHCMPLEKPKALYSTKNLEMDIHRLSKSNTIEEHRVVLERQLASSSLAGVIGFMDLTSDASLHGQLDLVLHDICCSMRLDAAAQKALNMFPQRTDEGKLVSLYGLLNQARTAMGKRKIKIWMKQPLVDVEAINRRLDLVQCFVEDNDLHVQLRNCLRGFPDMPRLARKLARKKSSLADMCKLYRASSLLPRLEGCIRGAGVALLNKKFADLFAALHDDDHLGRFEQLVEAAIDLDKVPNEYLISPQYDNGLEGLRVTKEKVEREVQELFQRAASDLNLVPDKTLKLDWYKTSTSKVRCLRITQKEERILRKTLQQRFTILEARKDGMKFVSPELRKVAEQLQSISNEYETRQSDLVSQVIEVAATFVEVFEDVGEAIAEIDAIAGLADIAKNASVHYVRPTILGGDCGKIYLRGCRHPLVEVQDGVDFIKNDCDMVRGESWFQIVTGPNMGGKSTYIRQVGVCILMAQIGSFVPCDEAIISVRDCIFARVGAGDSQLRGVSTFMAEMLETAAILKGATEKSLVIIDELGRGTSTYDGFGLAWAISYHIMQTIGCPTLFATHFHELTAITGPGGVKNRHVETCVDDMSGRLTMLYQVADGACDQSFGIHVAEFAQFPEGVVRSAKKRLRAIDERDKELMKLWDKKKKTDGEKKIDSKIDYFIEQLCTIDTDKLQVRECANALELIVEQLNSDKTVNDRLLGLLA